MISMMTAKEPVMICIPTNTRGLSAWLPIVVHMSVLLCNRCDDGMMLGAGVKVR